MVHPAVEPRQQLNTETSTPSLICSQPGANFTNSKSRIHKIGKIQINSSKLLQSENKTNYINLRNSKKVCVSICAAPGGFAVQLTPRKTSSTTSGGDVEALRVAARTSAQLATPVLTRATADGSATQRSSSHGRDGGSRQHPTPPTGSKKDGDDRLRDQLEDLVLLRVHAKKRVELERKICLRVVHDVARGFRLVQLEMDLARKYFRDHVESGYDFVTSYPNALWLPPCPSCPLRARHPIPKSIRLVICKNICVVRCAKQLALNWVDNLDIEIIAGLKIGRCRLHYL